MDGFFPLRVGTLGIERDWRENNKKELLDVQLQRSRSDAASQARAPPHGHVASIHLLRDSSGCRLIGLLREPRRSYVIDTGHAHDDWSEHHPKLADAIRSDCASELAVRPP